MNIYKSSYLKKFAEMSVFRIGWSQSSEPVVGDDQRWDLFDDTKQF